MATSTLGLLALSACDKSGKAPEGQVVATVDGKEVTIHELNAELALMGNATGNAPRKLVESVALARVIERKMLSQEAVSRKLDQNPQFLLAQTRTNEGLLVQALQADVQKKVPEITREAAQKFIAENPPVFGDRKIFTLDQIQFLRPANIDQLPLKDAKTMADVERVLTDANIEFRRAPQQLDSLTVNPALTKEILRISATANGEPFIFSDQPQGAPAPVIYVNNITNTSTQPFIGEKAIAYAQNVLQRQETQKRLAAELKKVQEAFKPKIVYGKGYGPPDFKAAEKEAQAEAAKAAATRRSTGVPAPTTAPAAAPAAAAK
ncbi:MAG: hypothetical protein CFE37_04545 [Alphaproteobacteria bacterium PA4]|nr:MAG: hypothetical protein CFE37_04545 [Alphaproteobacteria bacterium PA4]